MTTDSLPRNHDALPIPLHPYPGIRYAFADLVVAMRDAIFAESDEPGAGLIAEWVARETHRATAVEINAMIDRAIEHVVAGAPLPNRGPAIKRIDLLRNEISRQLAMEDVQERDIADELADGIIGVIAVMDPELHEHLDAVGVLSSRIAIALGHTAEFAKTCMLVGKLHDVGKLTLPRNVLYKPARLTPEEYALVRRHAAEGQRMVMGIPGLARYARAIGAHHERLDGSGYPRGLAGDDIPLEARIVAVADVFHAMTSPRCYSEPMAPGKAIAEIHRGRGRIYDAIVVDAAQRVFEAHASTAYMVA